MKAQARLCRLGSETLSTEARVGCPRLRSAARGSVRLHRYQTGYSFAQVASTATITKIASSQRVPLDADGISIQADSRNRRQSIPQIIRRQTTPKQHQNNTKKRRPHTLGRRSLAYRQKPDDLFNAWRTEEPCGLSSVRTCGAPSSLGRASKSQHASAGPGTPRPLRAGPGRSRGGPRLPGRRGRRP